MKKRVTPEVVLMAVALPRKRKGLLIVLVLLLLLGVGALCGYMYWASLPPQQFAYWPEEESTGAVREGVSLCIDEAGRNQDGSGYIKYILANFSWSDEYGEAEVAYYGPADPWIEYQYEGEFGDSFYQVYPRADSLTQLIVSSASPLEPGEKIQLVEILPKDTLPVAGVYRFCVERAGTVDFVVMNNGDVVADNEAYIKTSREYERQTATPVEP